MKEKGFKDLIPLHRRELSQVDGGSELSDFLVRSAGKIVGYLSNSSRVYGKALESGAIIPLR